MPSWRPDDRADRILADLRALQPEMGTFLRMPAPALTRLHMDPEGSGSGSSGSAMLATLPEAGIDAFLAAVGGPFRDLADGGRAPPARWRTGPAGGAGGAVSHLDGQFLAFGTGMVDGAERLDAGSGRRRGVHGCAHPVDGRTHVPELRRGRRRPRQGYDEVTWRQLTGLRSVIDPAGTFAANHPVPRLYEDGRPTC